MVKGRQTIRLPPQHRKGEAAKSTEPSDGAGEPTEDPLSPANLRRALVPALSLITLAAFASPISQATLRPVYGAIPASISHAEALTATLLVGFLWRHFADGYLETSILPYLALVAFWIPQIQIWLFKRSDSWGPVVGAMLTGFVSCHTLVIASAYAAGQSLERLDLQARLGSIAGAAVPALVLNLAYFRPVEALASKSLDYILPHLDPVKVQCVLALAYGGLSGRKPYWLWTLGLPSLLLAFVGNPHTFTPYTLSVANRDLEPTRWKLLDRAWSTTGYIAVLEDTEQAYRALRCDHSLLGGEWLLTPERRQEGWLVEEPIYAVFTMLEAVRLVETTPAIHDDQAKALVIGLGAGTAPKAMIAHGIDTTVVELDPVVHRYAAKYFGLPSAHTAVVSDAVAWVGKAVATNATRYDYIIHDVFTGGAEPLALFTDTFLAGLRALLADNGVIAINYAGDPSLPLTKTILRTVHSTFGGQCRIFRDAPPSEPGPQQQQQKEEKGKKKKGREKGDEEFVNMVIFCLHPSTTTTTTTATHSNTPNPITFRAPTRQDFLGSKQRQAHLLPKPEWEQPFPPASTAGDPDAAAELDGAPALWGFGAERGWRRAPEESAVRHWRIMRRAVPGMVWEMW